MNATGRTRRRSGARPARPPDPSNTAQVGRQPIYDRTMTIQAWELLYRAPGATRAEVQNPGRATAEVLVSATLDIGLDHLVGTQPAYINFPPELLTSRFQPPLNPARVVIEVLEGTAPVEELLQGLANLRAQGFRIALDDFDIRTESALLLDHADIVKVDVREHSPEELAASVARLRQYPVQLVAEKIETQEELEICRNLGFDLFQGYLLQRPETVQAWRAPSSRLTVLELIVRLNDPHAPVDSVERAICADPGLGYRLLHGINSSYSGMPRKFRSIREAILQLGLSELHKLCWLLLLAGIDRQPVSPQTRALVRACMCEALAERAGLDDRESYFMTGMLSMLETFSGPPLEQTLEQLPLDSEVRRALICRDGDLGAALNCVECYEYGNWSQLTFRRLSPGQIAAAHLDAVERAEQSWSALLHAS